MEINNKITVEVLAQKNFILEIIYLNNHKRRHMKNNRRIFLKAHPENQ
jgi:hypothetical protein